MPNQGYLYLLSLSKQEILKATEMPGGHFVATIDDLSAFNSLPIGIHTLNVYLFDS